VTRPQDEGEEEWGSIPGPYRRLFLPLCPISSRSHPTSKSVDTRILPWQ